MTSIVVEPGPHAEAADCCTNAYGCCCGHHHVLCRSQGVPPELRGWVWWHVSGAGAAAAAGPGHYEACLQAGSSSAAVKQVRLVVMSSAVWVCWTHGEAGCCRSVRAWSCQCGTDLLAADSLCFSVMEAAVDQVSLLLVVVAGDRCQELSCILITYVFSHTTTQHFTTTPLCQHTTDRAGPAAHLPPPPLAG